MDDGASDASSSGLPPPLISADDYDALMCSACVRKISAARRIAGTPGVLMVVRSSADEPWCVIGRSESGENAPPVDVVAEEAKTENGASDSAATGEKRGRSASVAEGPDAKRVRVSPEGDEKGVALCLAPRANSQVQHLLDRLDASKSQDTTLDGDKTSPVYLGAGDVFFTEGWRNRWCSCMRVGICFVYTV